jgi:hypothetical protein
LLIGEQIILHNQLMHVGIVLFISKGSGPNYHAYSFIVYGRPTDWLSGSGGTGETLHIIAPFLANRACAERQSRCPLEPVLASPIENECIPDFQRLSTVFVLIFQPAQSRQPWNTIILARLFEVRNCFVPTTKTVDIEKACWFREGKRVC